jgi:hypothetical protein
MAHVTATMVASVIVLEGIGAMLLGSIAAATSPATAYATAGALLLSIGGSAAVISAKLQPSSVASEAS